MSKITNLDVLYYITSGIRNIRMYDGKPFYINYPLKSKENNFNIKLIKSILEKDKIDISNIDEYRYLNKNKNGFIKIKESFLYPLESNELILQIHFKEQKNKDILEIESSFNNMTLKVKELEDKKNIKKTYKNDNTDFYFLYASPIVSKKKEDEDKDKYEEEYTPINYRPEIKKICNIFENSKKEYNCIFECANEKKLREALIKQPKILHISSHGKLYENRQYSLFLEEKGVLQKVTQKRLKEILSIYSNQLKNIDLVFASTCYSETLGKLFLESGINNVIYIQGMNKVSDKAAIKFSELFYKELIKGNTIKDSFDKSKRLIQSDKGKESFQYRKCCCSHWHASDCPLRNVVNIHNKYHIKCDCDFEEYNIHDENCKLLQVIKNDKVEKYFFFEKNNNNTIKICCICCKPQDDKEKMLPHGESFKFILKQKNPNDNNIIFRYKNEGKMTKNKNCYIMNDKDKFKNFSIVGRRKQVKEIYDIIDNGNINNIHFIIIHGTYEVGKQNFAESVCIYLYERKIINGYWMIYVKESKEELNDKIKELTHNGKNSDGKYIVVIKINYNLEKPIDLLNEILNEKNIMNPYFYYIILIIAQDDNKIEYSIQCQDNKYKIIYLMNLTKKSSIQLLYDLCESYGYSINFNNLYVNNQIDELIEITGYSRKNINELAELIGKYSDFEKLKNILKSQEFNNSGNIQNELRKLMEKKISKIYFLLSIMVNGLPSSFIYLYEPDFQKIIKKEDEEKIIYIEPNNNWYTIIEKRYKRDIGQLIQDGLKKEYIGKCLEIYAKILFYYIKYTRKKVCFPDSNIHYHFNSYNNKGIWKTFDNNIYEFYFLREDKSNEYNTIFENDFVLENIEKHTENIYYLIEKNVDIIKDLIYKDRDNNVEQKEYLYQILLMVPSIYVEDKYSNFKTVITRFLHLCDKLKESDINNVMDSKQRLNLYFLSMKENPIINFDEFNLLGDEGKANAYFINGLKKKDKDSFLNSIDLYEKLNNKELKIQIPYAYYEIGRLYFSEQNYDFAEDYLNDGGELSKQYNDGFIKDKINIQLALVMEAKYHNKEKYELYLKKVINEGEDFYLISEANNLLNRFSRKLEPDIVMLNSNPFTKKNNCSVLHYSMWAYHNNQYYILQKISTKIKKNIRIKSIVLNAKYLIEALKEKGKILIIQSDDFNEEGEIHLESQYGEGESLPNNQLKEIFPKQLYYEVVILCFIKSEKIKNFFKEKVKYLITFNDINIEDIDCDLLLQYNKLSIDFIIHFIENSFNYNIIQSFEQSLKTFKTGLANFNNSTIELINSENDFISLDKYNVFNNSIIYEEKEKIKDGEIVYVYPLLQIPFVDLHNKNYTEHILHLIKLILSGEQIINIFAKNDIPIKENLNIKTIIAFEIMRFLYRHQKFNGRILYASNPKNLGFTLSEITNKIIGKIHNISKEKSLNFEEMKSAFIVINNFEKVKKLKGNKGKKGFFENIPYNIQYLIISKNPIDKATTYEIPISKDDNSGGGGKPKGDKKNKKNKNKLKKISSKNKIFDKSKNSGEMTDKENINNSSPDKKKDSQTNKKDNKLQIKSRYDKETDFTILAHISSDSDNSGSSLSNSEDSDF